MAGDLLLDSNVLVWLSASRTELDSNVLSRIQEPTAIIYASVASLWELRIKQSTGKLVLPDHFFSALYASNLIILPIEPAHIEMLGTLPFHHRDPFDRMLVAQALSEKMMLVTADQQLARYGINILPAT